MSGDFAILQNARNQSTIGPRPKTPGTQVGERITGALKGAAFGALETLDLLASSPQDNEASRLIAQLQPNTQDEKFGGDVFGIASLFFGFESFEEVGAGRFVGQFSNGASMLLNLSNDGDTLTVGNPLVTKVSAETFRKIEAGAIGTGRAQGASKGVTE